MSIVMHPLTALNGAPAYTAADYRHAVNPFLFPSDGSAFGCVQGVRYTGSEPLCLADDLVVSVKPHCGVCNPWAGVGGYTYAVTETETVTIPDSVNSYKIAVTVEDPSQSHGDMPRGMLKVVPATTDDSVIPGLVIGQVSAGTVSDVALRIGSSGLLMAWSEAQVLKIPVLNGLEAVLLGTGARYRVIGGVWRRIDDIELGRGQWYGDWSSVEYKCSMSDNIVSLYVKVTRGPEWVAKAWTKSQILTFPDYVKPDVIDLNVPAAGTVNSGFQLDETGLYVRPFADITYEQGSWSSATLSWSV